MIFDMTLRMSVQLLYSLVTIIILHYYVYIAHYYTISIILK